MSKQTRQHRPTPNKTVRVVLTVRDFRDFHGVCAVAAIRAQAIQIAGERQLVESQQARQQAFTRLLRKYRHAGLRPDVEYVFDDAMHALVEVRSHNGEK
jgi:hypothetical protein